MDEFYQVKELISSGQYEEAENLLMSLQLTEDQAQWNYLMAQVSMGKGWLEYATQYGEKAYQAEPENETYKQFYETVQKQRSGEKKKEDANNAAECCLGLCECCVCLTDCNNND